MQSNYIILDRDGVINCDSDNYIKTVDEWIPLPNSIKAISQLSKAGFSILVATNQSGLARAYFDEFTLANMHTKMCNFVEEQGGHISGVFFCPHLPNDNCACRKPKTGLLDQMETEFTISLTGSWFIGDSEKDIDAALAKGCKPILVLTGKGVITQAALTKEKLEKVLIFEDLYAASHFILAQLTPSTNSDKDDSPNV